MKMSPCSIRFCGKDSTSSNLKKDGITFHRYPKDPILKEKWINATMRENWLPSRYSVVCSRHFEEDCLVNLERRRRLLRSAVPTLFIPVLTNAVEPKIESIAVIPSSPRDSISHSSDQSVPNADNPVLPVDSIHATENPSDYNTVDNKRLSRRIMELTYKLHQKNKQIKNLRAKTKYLKKKVVTLQSTLKKIIKQTT